MTRTHNFCAGPCTLPVSVLNELSSELPDFEQTGMSLIEMSHRDPIYDRVHHETIDLFRTLCRVPDNFSILLLQGGASLQFAMVPINLLAGPEAKGAYIASGSWANKALAEAQLVGNAYPAWSGADEGFRRMPRSEEIELEPQSSYLHVTSNETIGGIRLPSFPKSQVPLVADMSSDYLTRHIPWDDFDLVYGGAQKNIGPAGLTVVFVRNSLLESIPSDKIPTYLSYKTHADADSLANTPPVFAIWATGKMLKWISDNGGVDGMEARAAQRSSMIYDAIDNSDGFYNNPVDGDSRSHTNIVFRLRSEDLEAQFLAEAVENNLMNLKGHRSVGGIRASVYNALPTSSVKTLTEFMAQFAAKTL